jgi:hypothetical protein
MRVFIISILFSAFVVSAAEYGYFYRNDTNGWSSSTPIELNDGDRFVVLNSDQYLQSSSSYGKKVYRVGSRFILDNGITIGIIVYNEEEWTETNGDSAYHSFTYAPENARTIVYGGSISVDDSVSGGSYIAYKIIRASEEEGGSKFTASLNSDGSRLAIGSKIPGSNAVTRVYEFDGSSWNQLGEDVE